MKKLTALILSIIMLLSFAACGDKKPAENTDPDPSEQLDPVTPDNPTNPDDPSNPDDPTVNPDDPDPTNPTDTPTTPTNPTTPTDPTDPTDPSGGNNEEIGEFDLAGALDKGVIFSTLKGSERESFIKSCEDADIKVEFLSDGTTVMTDTEGSVIKQRPDGALVVTDSTGVTAVVGGKWQNTAVGKHLPDPGFGSLEFSSEIDGIAVAQLSGVTEKNFTSYCDACKSKGFSNVQYNVASASEGYTFLAQNSAGLTLGLSLEDGILIVSVGDMM